MSIVASSKKPAAPAVPAVEGQIGNKTKNILKSILCAKKVACFVGPMVASCVWGNVDINESALNYSPPVAIVQEAKVMGRDSFCPDFQNGDDLRKGDVLCNNMFGTKSYGSTVEQTLITEAAGGLETAVAERTKCVIVNRGVAQPLIRTLFPVVQMAMMP